MVAGLWRRRELVYGPTTVILLLLIWELASTSGLVNPVIIPPFDRVLTVLLSGKVLPDTLATLQRMLLGYVGAVVLAIPLGIVIGYWRGLYRVFEPVIDFFRGMPAAAIVPIAIVFFGIGTPMKVVVVAYACFFPVLINTIGGVNAVEPLYVLTARSMGYSEREIAWRVILPAAVPYIMSGLRISLAISLIVTVVAEMIATIDGLGYYILIAQATFRAADMFAGILALAIIGLVLSQIYVQVFERLTPWTKERQ